MRGGTFTIGSPDGKRQRGEEETAHEVTIGDFYADLYEGTQADYEQVMGVNLSCFKGTDLPVDSVIWYDVAQFCNRLSGIQDLTPVDTIDG